MGITYGLPKGATLPAWVTDPKIQEAFPEIKHIFEPKKKTIVVEKNNGDWVLQASLKHQNKPRYIPLNNQILSATSSGSAPLYIAVNREPSTSRVEKKIMEFHKDFPHSASIKLSDSNITYPDSPKIYKHKSFTSKERIAYFDRLIQIGVMKKEVLPNHQYDEKNKHLTTTAYLYTFTNTFTQKINSTPIGDDIRRSGYQFYLGEKTPRIIGYEVKPIGPRYSMIYFRTRVTYEHPPKWMLEYKDKWPELAQTLEGQVCSSALIYDHLLGTLNLTGSGTCSDVYKEDYFTV